MTFSRIGFGKLLIATAMTFAMVSAANAYTQEQEAMCTNDAFRVCGSDIPDVQRVTACMIRNKSQLSAGCRTVMNEQAPAPAASATYQPVSGKASKPMNLVPPKAKRTGA
jgi:hypothetical protein